MLCTFTAILMYGEDEVATSPEEQKAGLLIPPRRWIDRCVCDA